MDLLDARMPPEGKRAANPGRPRGRGAGWWKAFGGCAVAVWLALAGLATAAAQNPAGHWEGEILIPGMPLQVLVDLVEGPDGWSGTIDIPLQNAHRLPLEALRIEPPEVGFTVRGIAGSPTFAGRVENDSIRGEFTQGPSTFSFDLGRGAVAPLRRPQLPTGPFPYLVEEVEYFNGAVRLAATLTVPPGQGPHPAALLITGSGAQDRDESLLGHRPFLVLADWLSRAGYAVLRADDRGVGGSSGSVSSSTSEDFAADALAGIALLRSDPRIDPRAVGVIGHSEGGLVGPLAASRSEDVAFVVMLAGTGVPGSEILVRQLELIARANGVAPAAIAKQLELQQEVLQVIRSTAPDQERRAEMRRIVGLQIGLQQAAQGAALDAAVEQAIEAVLNPWFAFFVDFDPRPTLRQVTVPVLVLSGALDLQVDPAQNIPEIAAALLHGGNPDVTIRVLPGLNHLFQTAATGSPQEYSMIEETFAPVALGALVRWLGEHFPVPSRAASEAASTKHSMTRE